MAEQQLHGSQVASLLVNLCHLGAAHRVGPISRAIETGALHPVMYDPSVLPCRDVRMITKSARKQVLTASEGSTGKPVLDCRSGLFGNLELDPACRFFAGSL